ncbi:hypothetical protein AAW51_0044 [Caldimonas brevitalea]|uniref:Uncharacterized protein n=2 Tax=Caldimonas brevitalea TaxID=413882 RepID=A0A0G3BJL5_9BURK|nr:hypothetical protein AAW51_0044 [Caldimonas brevitalea]
MLHSGAQLAMDPYAQEIFDLWFSGKAPSEVVFDNEKWARYMQADAGLQQQIAERLAEHAASNSVRMPMHQNGGRHEAEFQLTWHAEVGGETGGYRSGYAVLHGTDRTVGDFGASGRFSAVRRSSGEGYTVTYTDLRFVFNDRVNMNKKYASDVQFGVLAGNMARCLGGDPPRDYILRVVWREPGPRKFDVGGGLLKEFRNL